MKKILLISLFSLSLFAKHIGTVQTTTGDAEVKRNKKIITVKAGCKLEKDDILMTKEKSSILVRFNNGQELLLGSKTLLSIDKYISRSIKRKSNGDSTRSKEKLIIFSLK
jgi:hypothetical protein